MGRMDKVNQQVKRELGIMLQRDMNDPRFQFVTITHVEVSPDLKNAKVYFSFLGDQAKAQDTEQTLNRAAGLVRKLIGKRITMRYTPEFCFKYDASIEFGARIEQTLQEFTYDKKNNPTAEEE